MGRELPFRRAGRFTPGTGVWTLGFRKLLIFQRTGGGWTSSDSMRRFSNFKLGSDFSLMYFLVRESIYSAGPTP